jgi:hypothetical protein
MPAHAVIHFASSLQISQSDPKELRRKADPAGNGSLVLNCFPLSYGVKWAFCDVGVSLGMDSGRGSHKPNYVLA